MGNKKISISAEIISNSAANSFMKIHNQKSKRKRGSRCANPRQDTKNQTAEAIIQLASFSDSLTASQMRLRSHPASLTMK